MRKVLWATLFVLTLLITLPVRAQNPNYDVGPVWRVTYYHITPGQGEAFWKDFRENLKPVYESLKKEGLISDYRVWVNITTESRGQGLQDSVQFAPRGRLHAAGKSWGRGLSCPDQSNRNTLPCSTFISKELDVARKCLI